MFFYKIREQRARTLKAEKELDEIRVKEKFE